MPPSPKTLTIPLNRSGRPGQWEAFTANPLRLIITSAEAALTGITEIRAELHPQRLVLGQPALAAAFTTSPSGYSATIDFTAQQLNQDLGGAARRSFWLLIRVILADESTDVYDLGALDLLAHPASDTVSPPPPVTIFASTVALAAEIAARTSGDSTLTAAIVAEAAARAAADAAFALRTTGNNYGDQAGDTFTMTVDPGGAFSALSPPFAASAAGTFRLNEDGEYVPTSSFSGAVENWYDLDLADPASLITVGMLPALLTRLGITYPTP